MSEVKSSKYNVLYVEDDPANVGVDFERLKNVLPIQLAVIPSLKDTKEIIETYHFDLFILDIEITGERSTGIQFAEQIRQMPLYAMTPIIFTSMHSHYSHWLLSTIQHCSFLPKPFTEEVLENEIGVALGLHEYIEEKYTSPSLLLSYGRDAALEIDPLTVSYIEVTNRTVFIQYINGQTLNIKCISGMLKALIEQIETKHISCLRQIYRSIIINVNQIKSIEMKKNIATVQLFSETQPFPVGMNYRNNLLEFI